MARCNCSGKCACFLEAGDNVTITGAGSELSPYHITASGGGGGAAPWTRLVLNVELPAGTTSVIDTDDVADPAVLGAAYLQHGGALVACPANTLISGVQLFASAPKAAIAVLVTITKMAALTGVIAPGTSYFANFTPGSPLDTVVVGPYPAVASMPTHFIFPAHSDSEYVVDGTGITMVTGGYYQIDLDVSWGAP